MNITDAYKLLDKLPGDWTLYHTLADIYEEKGKESLARTVRWMIKNRKHPYKFIDDTYKWYTGNDLTMAQSIEDLEWYLPYDLMKVLSPYKESKHIKSLIYVSLEECIDELSQVPNLDGYGV